VIDFLAVLSLFIAGFLLGLFAIMTLDYCCFHWGLLSMAKLSHSSFDRDQTLEV
jgi:hypothetical protein